MGSRLLFPQLAGRIQRCLLDTSSRQRGSQGRGNYLGSYKDVIPSPGNPGSLGPPFLTPRLIKEDASTESGGFWKFVASTNKNRVPTRKTYKIPRKMDGNWYDIKIEYLWTLQRHALTETHAPWNLAIVMLIASWVKCAAYVSKTLPIRICATAWHTELVSRWIFHIPVKHVWTIK